MITADSALLSPPSAEPAPIIRAILARPHGDYDAAAVGAIVTAYWQHAAAVGLDPLLLLAQLLHETGNLTSWWAQRPRRNPAGIGVTGRTSPTRPAGGAWVMRESVWVEGVSFASWAAHAVPAHVGRLLAYAVRDADASAAQRAAIAQALAVRPLPASFRGAAPMLRGLNGRWAVPGRTYADALARMANRIARG